METSELKHIYWRSRRGMLELELRLVPFVRDCYADLPAEEQATYEAMLEEEDWQLFDWLQGRETPENELTRTVLGKIQAHKGRL